jgi:hypothetical protein
MPHLLTQQRIAATFDVTRLCCLYAACCLQPQVPQAKLDNATFADAARGKMGIALNIEYLEPLTPVSLLHVLCHMLHVLCHMLHV